MTQQEQLEAILDSFADDTRELWAIAYKEHRTKTVEAITALIQEARVDELKRVRRYTSDERGYRRWIKGRIERLQHDWSDWWEVKTPPHLERLCHHCGELQTKQLNSGDK